MFGQTVTMSGDSMTQHKNHKHAHPKKWLCMDIECDAGCGVVPFKYRDQSFVNALQWAIGLETFLLAEDAEKIFLTTDHPNGGPFTSYPHLIKLLMDKTFRDDLLARLAIDISEHTILKDIKREYTLSEIATMTRSAPAKILGLKNKGSLSDGADADITVYDSRLTDVEDMFAHPSHVIKDGILVVKNGEIKDYIWGKTQVVRPEYDPSIEKKLDKHFKKYNTIGLSNFVISNDEMSEVIGSDVNINDCLRKRIS
jgi:formylmethanofuran dehydrogenase subunit A